ncbi:MAG: hypothetical protein D4R58_02725 [Betaproteobacteria bacterium]|nr:MAG: hypothetical protein D4R58_02725 [Betaproteobacteria bacterium]
MNALPVKRACELTDTGDQPQWLIEGLWADQAVGILGGQPKCCKSFLALDIAVSVAAGTPCLRRFPVRRTGPVLLFPAEDALAVVRQRLEGICMAAGAPFDKLPLYVITAPRLLLDLPQDRDGLRATVAELRPALLILDPFIRLHRADENASKDVAPLLGYLRELQRQFGMAVLLVHHIRKGSSAERPGQALRGSSDLHGWGDSNLYLRRNSRHLILSVEQRAAPSPDDISLHLSVQGNAPSLAVLDAPQIDPAVAGPSSPADRILLAISNANGPLTAVQLRKACRIRTSTISTTTASLVASGRIHRSPNGYSHSPQTSAVPVSLPLPL